MSLTKPKKENFGYQYGNSFESESGWLIEGGEGAYYKAIENWEINRRQDLEQCESCEGFFDPDKMTSMHEEIFCKNCWEGIQDEMRQTGIKHLDEYLESRNLPSDFHLFSCAKWSGVTEEEYKEINGYLE